jgi:hypothetical protein
MIWKPCCRHQSEWITDPHSRGYDCWKRRPSLNRSRSIAHSSFKQHRLRIDFFWFFSTEIKILPRFYPICMIANFGGNEGFSWIRVKENPLDFYSLYQIQFTSYMPIIIAEQNLFTYDFGFYSFVSIHSLQGTEMKKTYQWERKCVWKIVKKDLEAHGIITSEAINILTI